MHFLIIESFVETIKVKHFNDYVDSEELFQNYVHSKKNVLFVVRNIKKDFT